MMGHQLEVKNLYKKYARREVVNDVSFSVKGGEIVGLLGPNGAGKTTCFYITCGLVRSSKGEVNLDNKSIGNMPMHKRANLGLGYLPQEPSIFRKLSVEDNILAVLEMNKSVSAKDRPGRLEELLSEFKVEHVRHIKGITLSGGERRRVEIARALAMDPKFILLDEPFAGIDPISIIEIQKIIKELVNADIGVLITDHNVRETLKVCDEAYIISDGKVIAYGQPSKIVKDKIVQNVYLGDSFKL